MYLKIKGKIVAMNNSVMIKDAFDVLLEVTASEGAPGAKNLISRKIVFNGVQSDKPFFVDDIINIRYSEEMGPRHFIAEVLPTHTEFTSVLNTIKRSND